MRPYQIIWNWWLDQKRIAKRMSGDGSTPLIRRLWQVRLLYSKLGYAAAAPPPELLEILDVAEIRRENKVFFTGLEPDV